MTLAQQASYVRQAMTIVRADPRVEMFVWFIWQDSRTSLWAERHGDALRGDQAGASAVHDRGSPRRRSQPRSHESGPAARHRPPAAARVLRHEPARHGDRRHRQVRLGSSLVAVSQPELLLGSDCTGATALNLRLAAKRNACHFDLNDDSGLTARRTVTIQTL